MTLCTVSTRVGTERESRASTATCRPWSSLSSSAVSSACKLFALVWSLTQSDQQNEFWYRTPFGAEGQVNVVLAVNHGASGSCAWNSYGTTQELLSNASIVATQLYQLTDFIYGAADSRQVICSDQPYCGINNIDLASWTKKYDNGTTDTLILAVNMQYTDIGSTISFAPANVTGTIVESFWGNVTQSNGTALFTLPRTSVAGAILRS